MRHFITFYTAVEGEDHVDGHIAFGYSKFPNFRELTTEIQNLYGLRNVTVTNVLEISEEDFKEWVRDESEESEDKIEFL